MQARGDEPQVGWTSREDASFRSDGSAHVFIKGDSGELIEITSHFDVAPYAHSSGSKDHGGDGDADAEDSKLIERPVCKLVGENGNIFNLAGLAGRTLDGAGLRHRKLEMYDRIAGAQSYDEALQMIMEYVDVE